MIAIFPEIIAAAKAKDLEALAVLVRKYFGGKAKFAPRIDLIELLATAGISVERSTRLPYHAALVATDEKGRFSVNILIKANLDPIDERFTLAHMFGHFLLTMQDQISRGELTTNGFREIESPHIRYTAGQRDLHRPQSPEAQEILADQFAASLLIPRAMLTRAMEKLTDIDRTAVFFGVSKPCLSERLNSIGLGMEPMAPSSQPTGTAPAEKRPQSAGGLGRLREIARKLDRMSGR